MKKPQWVYKTPSFVCHPSATLKEVAKILDMDATKARKSGDKEAGRVANYYAECLRRVAAGQTWAEAFTFETAE